VWQIFVVNVVYLLGFSGLQSCVSQRKCFSRWTLKCRMFIDDCTEKVKKDIEDYFDSLI